MKFGENLQKLRKERGISQEQLAEQLGVTRQSVSKWESGNSYPEMDKLVAICGIFNCELDSLINKDIIQERQKRDASSVVKDLFLNVTNYIKKTIYLFEHKSLKDIIKICAQVFIIVCVILLFSIPFTLLKEIITSLFYTGDNWFSLFFAKFWDFIFNGGYAIFAIATFFYIFKLKFLDNEEIIIEEVDHVKDENNSEQSLEDKTDEKKKVKIVKVKNNDFSLLNLLVKAITLCLKGIFILFLIPIIIGTIMMVIGLVILLVLIFKGLFLAGPILLILGIIVFALVIIELMLDFIFNLKFSKRRIVITIISSIVVSAIGIGLSIWYFLNLTIVNSTPKIFNQETQEEIYPMTDDFFIHSYGDIRYVADDSLTDQVRVRVDYYSDFNAVKLVEEDNEVYLNYDVIDTINIKEITDDIINNLKNNKFNTYYDLGNVYMTVTTSQENINKIKNNYNAENDSDIYVID